MVATSESTIETTEMTPQSTITKIVVIDSERSYVDALGLALELTSDLRIVAQNGEVQKGLADVRRMDADLLIAATLPKSTPDGLSLVDFLCQDSSRVPAIPVVFLTAYPNSALAAAAKLYRNVSVVSKQLPVTEVVRNIRTAIGGEEVFAGVHSDPYGLSPAEFEVLEFLVIGKNAASIAQDMHLSIHAIRARIRSLLAKTSSRSQLEAVAKAISHGIVAPPHLRGKA